MTRRFLWAVLALAAFGLAGCRGGQTLLTEGDSGTTVEVGVGQEIQVQLAGNPTTGYTWSLTGLDENFLQQQGEPDYKRDSDLIGAGGVYTFHFKALQAGQTSLTMAYARSFEPDIPPIQVFKITVMIR
jgi:inhibitor of cysteine peptidase